MRPALLELRGEHDFASCQIEFDRLYHTNPIYDVLGNKVLFERDRCEHVCFKSNDDIWNRGPRNQWSQIRAERIPWILETLRSPYEVRPNVQGGTGEIRIYLLRMDADPTTQAEQEYYCVIAIKEAKKLVRFLTAYPVNRKQWNNFRKIGPRYYPVG